MTDIDSLTQKVANHLAGRSVKIRWQSPPSESAAGQIVKTSGGQLIIYIGNLEGVKTRFRVLLHELAHARLDADWIPVSDDHKRPAKSIKRTQAARDAWRAHPRETRAQQQAEEWLQYAERNAYKHFTGYQTPMECKLLALLNWSEK